MTLGGGIGMTHGNKGYTLLELLLTIVIISILVAMLLSATAKAKEAAYLAQCHNYRRQLTIYYYASDDESDTYTYNTSDIERWNIKQELLLDHRELQNKCYDCHSTTP